MQDDMISTSQLCERYGRSARTLHRWQREIGFPRPVIAGGHGAEARWRTSDVKAWEDRRSQAA